MAHKIHVENGKNRERVQKTALSNRIPKPGNSFGEKYPEGVKAWSKTNLESPYDYNYGCKDKKDFICEKCGDVYKCSLNNYCNNTRCPRCKLSKGEKQIQKYLDDHKIIYIREHQFDDCVYINKLRFDFYLPDYNLLIEYQGKQHYIQSKNRDPLELIQKRDKIKRKYCNKNNIKLLEIKYTEFKNINNILDTNLL